MAFGLPTSPPEGLEFEDSHDDETCPSCGWDREKAAEDPQAAHNSGILLAIESGEGSPFTAMSTSLTANYWKCPECGTYFTTEDEVSFIGGMS
jgi:rubrerythrin